MPYGEPFRLVAGSGPSVLKSAQSGFESDWGTGYHLVDPLYGASRSVDDFLVAA